MIILLHRMRESYKETLGHGCACSCRHRPPQKSRVGRANAGSDPEERSLYETEGAA